MTDIEIIKLIACALAFIISSFSFGYLFGSVKSLRDDFKSIDYDRLAQENIELENALETVDKVNNRRR